MNQKMIVDTSIWIDYFKNKDTIVNIIESGLLTNSIFVTGPIVSELLQGVRSEKEYRLLSLQFNAIPFIDCHFTDWLKAGDLSFNLRKKGLTIPLTDIIIAAVSINNKIPVFSYDKHFEQIPDVHLIKL